jgi:hypothetical protein
MTKKNTQYEKLQEDLKAAGIVDTHYHVGPELLPRRYDIKTLADAANPWGATLVVKNHTYPTTPLASLARARFDADFFGGVVLNNFVGGLNPKAVQGAVSGNKENVGNMQPDSSPIVVWMPTVHAESHLETLGHAFDPRWSGCCAHRHDDHEEAQIEEHQPVIAFDKNLKPTKALLDVVEEIARNQCILATGHLSAKEIMKLVPLALDMGVPRIILTHPHYPAVALSDNDLKQLTAYPEVFIEHCFAIHTIEEVPLQQFSQAIRETGPEQVVLSTDFGQIFSAPFPDGTLHYAEALWKQLETFISWDDFIAMFSHNGRRALNLSAESKT